MHTNAHESDIKPRMHDNQHDAQLSHALGSFSPDSCRLVSIGGFQQVPSWTSYAPPPSGGDNGRFLSVKSMVQKPRLGLVSGFRASDLGFVWFGALTSVPLGVLRGRTNPSVE